MAGLFFWKKKRTAEEVAPEPVVEAVVEPTPVIAEPIVVEPTPVVESVPTPAIVPGMR